MTVSRLVMTPQSQDDGAHVTCRARNALIPGAAIEDSIKLDVQCNSNLLLLLLKSISGHRWGNNNNKMPIDVSVDLSLGSTCLQNEMLE